MADATNLNVIATVLAILLAAAIPALLPRLPVPGVVLEILLGALAGPAGLGLIHATVVLDTLANFGLAFVLLMAGFEIDPGVLRGTPIRLAFSGWLLSCIIAFAAALGLQAAGLGTAWTFTGLVLTTTAIGVLLPILRDQKLLAPPYGPQILAIGALGEAGPVVLLSLLLAGKAAPLQALLMLIFGAAVVLAMLAAGRAGAGRFGELVSRTLDSSGQLPVRLTLALLVLLSALSDLLHIETVLGAFLAGMIARAALRQHHLHIFAARLDGVGSAFLVPIFFVVSGAHLDIAGLLAHPASLGMVALYALLMLVARGAPVFLLYRRPFSAAQRIGLALHSGTQLSLVVAITGIAIAAHLMPPAQGTALVFGGIVTVLLFPPLARSYVRRHTDAAPEGRPAG